MSKARALLAAITIVVVCIFVAFGFGYLFMQYLMWVEASGHDPFKAVFFPLFGALALCLVAVIYSFIMEDQ